MAIPANRFEFLDKETNLPSKDFLTANSSSIFSELMPGLSEIASALGPLAGGGGLMDALGGLAKGGDLMGSLGELAKQSGVMDALGGLVGGEGGLSLDSLGGLGDIIRGAKDQLSTVIDFDKLSELDLDKMGEGLMSGNFSMDSLSGLGSAFKLDFLGGATGAMPGLDGLISGGKELMSVAGSMSGGMDVSKMLDGIMGSDSSNSRQVVNIGHQQRVLTAVGTMGMQANLPNVFTDVSSQVQSPGQLNVLGGALATRAVRNGSVNGVLEIAQSPAGGYITATVPDVNQQFITNFQIPPGMTSQDQQALYTQSVEAMETMQPGWSLVRTDVIETTSVAALPDHTTPWTALLQAQCLQTAPVIAPDLTVRPPSSTALLMVGQQSKAAMASSTNGYNAQDPFMAMRMQNPQWGAVLR